MIHLLYGYSDANDTQTRAGNDPQIGPQMILRMPPQENGDWHGVWFPGFIYSFLFSLTKR